MGIKRGDFESVNLGQVAAGVNPTYHERNSINPGLQAHAQGLKTLAESWVSIANGLTSISKFCSSVADMTTMSKNKTDKNREEVAHWKAELDKAYKENGGVETEQTKQIQDNMRRSADKMNYQSFWMFGQDDTDPNYGKEAK